MSGVPNQTTFAELLRRSRKAAGLTQEELAARAGLGVRTIRDLEQGVTRAPHRDTVTLLAAALGLAGEERAAFEAAAHPSADASPEFATHIPPLHPVERRPHPHNLPIQPTSLLGREQAARLLGAATALRKAIGAPRPSVERAMTEQEVATARQALGEEAWAAAFAAGRAMTLEEAIAEALGEDESAQA